MMPPTILTIILIHAGFAFLWSSEGAQQGPTTNESIKAMKQLLATVPAIDLTVNGLNLTKIFNDIATLTSELERHDQVQSNQNIAFKSQLADAHDEIQICHENAACLTKEVEVCRSKRDESQAALDRMAELRQEKKKTEDEERAILVSHSSKMTGTVSDEST
ncbi:hypothetical protein SVAN01_05352 [Stagonosporopsis vannaccii]|nr:hypothetical protein SVAN01_05352 [Stagonosporopsis vannaccii]